MLDQEKQELLQQRTISSIHNQRLNKELEIAKQYNHKVKQSQEATFITLYDILTIGSTYSPLTLVVPAEYPFEQPSYYIDEEKPALISTIIDEWSPKYRLVQIIQLITKRTQQQNQLHSSMKGNVVYRAFRHMNSIWGILLLAVIVRVLVGLGGYSGKGDWPQLGDFEAHRNWMSITLNRSLDDWYWEGDSSWWRIDYPPIAAYLSYIFGLIYYPIEPQALLLQQGYESESLTAYMRFTTLLTDLLFLIPALTLLISHTSPFHKPPTHLFFASVLLVLLKPDIILIDHGHFQYNSVALGLIIYSIYCVLTDRLYLCCVLFTLAINTKQMSAYYCLGFPAVLVGRTLIRYSRQYGKVGLRVLVFGVIVVGVCAVLWIPWLHHPADVLNAIFPLHRGLYQLKVPNWWCATDPLFKWQQRFTNQTLMVVCSGLCLVLSIPSMVLMMVKPSKKVTLMGFACISMTFFLFSYHAHEKSIIFPFILLPLLSQYLSGYLVIQLVIGGCAGMFHLLLEDGQALSYFSILVLYVYLAVYYYQAENKYLSVFHAHQSGTLGEKINYKLHRSPFILILTILTLITLHILKITVAPPPHLPFLYHYLFSLFSFALNIYYWTILNCFVIESLIQSLRKHKKN